jgi:hypothetical protein
MKEITREITATMTMPTLGEYEPVEPIPPYFQGRNVRPTHIPVGDTSKRLTPKNTVDDVEAHHAHEIK